MFETMLFYPLRDYCHAHGQEMWSEVTNVSKRNANTVDCVVNVKGKIYFSVELKTTLNLVVLAQAYNNLQWFNASCIGTPAVYNLDVGRKFAYKLCKMFGIGLIEYYPDKQGNFILPEETIYTIPPIVRTRPLKGKKNIETWLREEQKHAIGGVAQGKSTDWMKAMDACKNFLELNGVATTADLQEASNFYFKTPIECFRAISKYGKEWAKKTIVNGTTFFAFRDEKD